VNHCQDQVDTVHKISGKNRRFWGFGLRFRQIDPPLQRGSPKYSIKFLEKIEPGLTICSHLSKITIKNANTMVLSVREPISEIIILKVGLTFCGEFDRTTFVESAFDKMRKVNCFTYFELEPKPTKGFIHEDQLKYVHLIYHLKDVLLFMYRDIHPKHHYTFQLGRCLRQLINYIHLTEPGEENPSRSDEQIMIPKGLKKVFITDFIENTIYGLKATTPRSPFEINRNPSVSAQPPSILSEVEYPKRLSKGRLENILVEKAYRLREEGFSNFYQFSLKMTIERMYSLIGCLSFEDYVTKSLQEFDGYFHPLQPHIIINRPLLTMREQILLVLVRNTLDVLLYSYLGLFKWDTSPKEFYVNSVYPLLRSLQFDFIQFDDMLIQDEVLVVPSNFKEMSCEQFFEKIMNRNV